MIAITLAIANASAAAMLVMAVRLFAHAADDIEDMTRGGNLHAPSPTEIDGPEIVD